MITIFSTIIFCDCATRISIFFSSFQVFFFHRFDFFVVLFYFYLISWKRRQKIIVSWLILFICPSAMNGFTREKEAKPKVGHLHSLASAAIVFIAGVYRVCTPRTRARASFSVCVCVCRERQRVCKSDDFLGISATLCFFALGFRV